MESNNNDDNYGEEQQQQQMRGSTRKHKRNLANDGQGQRAAQGQQKQQQPADNLSKKKYEQQENDAFEVCTTGLKLMNFRPQMPVCLYLKNVHLESLSREDLIKLVRKLLVEKNEAQKTTTQVIAEKTKQIDALLVQLNESTWFFIIKWDRFCGFYGRNKSGNFSSILTRADLPSSAGRHRKLPAELNQQIFYCLNLATRRKFIYGLGWDFYAMFRHRLLTRVCIK
jgi:hypothetical protein